MVKPTDNVSQKIMTEIADIKAMSGKTKKIDTQAEYEALGKLLANETGKGNKDYIRGLMVEYENAYPTLDEIEAQKAQEEMMLGVSESIKKQVEKSIKTFKSSIGGSPAKTLAKFELNKLYNSGDLSADEIKYMEQVMEEYFVPLEEHVVKRPNLSDAEIETAETNARIVREALQGYTTKDEQKNVSDIINNNINSKNVMQFLYTYSKSTDGEGFFEQLYTEYNFPDKAQLLQKMTDYLAEYADTFDGESELIHAINVFQKEVAKNGANYGVLDSYFTLGGLISGARNLDKVVDLQNHIDRKMGFPVETVD